jgi:hypothetical protein
LSASSQKFAETFLALFVGCCGWGIHQADPSSDTQTLCSSGLWN